MKIRRQSEWSQRIRKIYSKIDEGNLKIQKIQKRIDKQNVRLLIAKNQVKSYRRDLLESISLPLYPEEKAIEGLRLMFEGDKK